MQRDIYRGISERHFDSGGDKGTAAPEDLGSESGAFDCDVDGNVFFMLWNHIWV